MRVDSLMKLSWSVPAAVLSLAPGLLLSLLKTPLAASGPTGDGGLPEIVFVQAPRVVAGELAKRFPQGSSLMRLVPGTQPPSATNLTPEFFAAADPQVFFDATKVLFSGQKTFGAGWQIWEMNSDGSHKRQLTDCPGDCLRSAYLPHNQIVFTVITRKGTGQASALYVSHENGGDLHPITFGPGNFQVETVLEDGRILVSAESPLMAGGKGPRSRLLYTISPDGTGLALFRRDRRADLTQAGAQELDDGTVLFVERRGIGGQGGGGLAWIRPGTLHNTLITPPQSICWSAHALEGQTLVVAERSPVSPASNGKFDLYTFDLASETLGQLIYRNPESSSVEAIPLEAHRTPRYYWSILHPRSETGRVICLNSYLSADAPHGRWATRIAQVRVIMLDQGQARARVLGEAPVETDGSFYILVPADCPIRFELLDAKGTVIRAQRSWIWARPGEDAGCLGCHEDKALAPENHWPLALKRLDTPLPLGVSVGPQPAHPVRDK